MNSGQYGGGPNGGRYNAGRVPQGVEFVNMPGRAATPLPTSNADKQAERIAQLEIWNRAVQNPDGPQDGGSNLTARTKSREAGGIGGGPGGGTGSNRRTDEYDDAKQRHTQSFQPNQQVTADQIFADFDDSAESSDDERLVTDNAETGETAAAQSARPPPPEPPAAQASDNVPPPSKAPESGTAQQQDTRKPTNTANQSDGPSTDAQSKDPKKGACCTLQ